MLRPVSELPRLAAVHRPTTVWCRFLAYKGGNATVPAADGDSRRREAKKVDGAECLAPYMMYSNRRRCQSAGLTTVAAGQAMFWASTSSLSMQTADPLLGPGWTLFGFGLSAAFGVMVSSYLRRMVAHVELLNGPVVRVTPHTLAGLLGFPVDIPAADIVPGPHGDDEKSRHWTFGVRMPSGRTFYYILDMKAGVVDREGLSAVVRGGEHFMAWSLKRDAVQMKGRWQKWRNDSIVKA